MRERLRLIIIGTGVELDAMGLPMLLRGAIHQPPAAGNGDAASGEPGPRVGTYEEEVKPILSPDLRGTLGLCRLELPGGVLVTETISLVQGGTPDGRILVQSSGRVTGGEGRFAGARGSLSTESRVRLAPFEMRVDLVLSLGARWGAAARARRRARARSAARWRRG